MLGRGGPSRSKTWTSPFQTVCLPADVAPRGATDDQVDVADVLALLRWAVGLDLPLTDEEWLRADVAPAAPAKGFAIVGGNGALDVNDVLLVLRVAVQLDDLRWPLHRLAARVTEETATAAFTARASGWPRWATPAGFESMARDESTAGDDSLPGLRGLTCVVTGAPLATLADLGVWDYRAPEPVSAGALDLSVSTWSAQDELETPAATLVAR